MHYLTVNAGKQTEKLSNTDTGGHVGVMWGKIFPRVLLELSPEKTNTQLSTGHKRSWVQHDED